jgi:hypothetical protein
VKPEDTTTSPWGRGTCRVCDRPFNLLKNGKVRHHGGEDGTDSLGFGRAYRCAGAGDWPKETP